MIKAHDYYLISARNYTGLNAPLDIVPESMEMIYQETYTRTHQKISCANRSIPAMGQVGKSGLSGKLLSQYRETIKWKNVKKQSINK